MTNREYILKRIAELDDEELYDLMSDVSYSPLSTAEHSLCNCCTLDGKDEMFNCAVNGNCKAAATAWMNSEREEWFEI